MNFPLILIALIGIIMSIAKKSNQAQQQKRKTFPETDDSASGSSRPMRDPRNRPAHKTPVTGKPGSSSNPSSSKWSSPAQSAAQTQRKAANSSYAGTPRYTHVVTSTLEGGHTHTESSLTGEDDCPPPKAADVQHPTAVVPAVGGEELLNLSTNSVLQGVLFAEILGKPKALQGK